MAAEVDERPSSTSPRLRLMVEETAVYSDSVKDLLSMSLHAQLLMGMPPLHFRSFAWMIVLRQLTQATWLRVIREERERFNVIQAEVFISEKRFNVIQAEVSEPVGSLFGDDDPLSQREDSTWNKFFADQALKATIAQDVDRTFPELSFFRDMEVRKMMVQILFQYARKNEHLGYKQGMHEILGPILFVCLREREEFKQECSQEDLRRYPFLRDLLSPEYVLHDAFFLFNEVMHRLALWYDAYHPKRRKSDRSTSTPSPDSSKDQQTTETPASDDSVFHPPSDASCEDQGDEGPSELLTFLSHLWHTKVRQTDHELYLHLEALEIHPQVYGIRWLRLLFGREFPLNQLLSLWDAIFATASDDSFPLVSSLFVAHLRGMRWGLLRSDFAECLHLLMQPLPGEDVRKLIGHAYMVRDARIHGNPAFSDLPPEAVAPEKPSRKVSSATEARPEDDTNNDTSRGSASNPFASDSQPEQKSGAAVITNQVKKVLRITPSSLGTAVGGSLAASGVVKPGKAVPIEGQAQAMASTSSAQASAGKRDSVSEAAFSLPRVRELKPLFRHSVEDELETFSSPEAESSSEDDRLRQWAADRLQEAVSLLKAEELTDMEQVCQRVDHLLQRVDAHLLKRLNERRRSISLEQ
ncbi:unnamed protein product [Cyprideis torosa]|uniref:Uncharacterized protein n=1 Tax=Cyprideis torosa TaxID=163714 RepID=A0A7R8ZIX4_9CRUS|nr:unnamed protein product [Cyprideis torosa]CAG0887263.1 unnamed protein product [Cyprideis torosa]